MATIACVRTSSPALESLGGLELRLRELDRAGLREALAPVADVLREPLAADELNPVSEAVLAFCRLLYSNSRSGEALPLARAILAQARLAKDAPVERRAASACGLLCADIADVVRAIEYHVEVLRLADGDPVEASGAWNNIGMAMSIAANYEMAARCYQRAVALVECRQEPLFSRYAACLNLAASYFQLGAYEDGLRFGERALREEISSFRDRDLMGVLRLRRNLVRLLVGAGRVLEAQPYVAEAGALAESIRTPRAMIAATTARAVFELATGHEDVGLTRLEQALTGARSVPAALRDTLACVIRAEEMAGFPERALLRLDELGDHVYRAAVERAHEQVELEGLAGRASGTVVEREQQQARARLISKLAPRTQPEGWSALERLAVSAVMRVDSSGWHGKRVGTLTKMLAMASGIEPLPALEMGLAAELHDIGLACVPEEIVSRKGPLSATEQRILMRHVDAGAEMLRDDSHPRIFLAREIASYHHARWDGGGYPDNVSGKLIPFAARACAIADAYDDMVCGLGNTKPRKMDDALRELHRQAGRQFDPTLVGHFEHMIRAETEDLGMDISSNSDMGSFQELVEALQADRGFA